ncbi:MAG: 3-methyl-2-oxobutanoate hydroxymethyltransferase [Acidimicrobiales bacterium]
MAVVKLEGAHPDLVEALRRAGIAVMGHLGLTPQSVHATGGYKVQAHTAEAADRLLDDARRLETAGACALVLEAVPSQAARRVTDALSIPTIGIGAGPHCDGQVLVSTEMLGLSAGPRPRFAKRYADLRTEIARAAGAFADEVAQGAYPDHEHSYDWAVR